MTRKELLAKMDKVFSKGLHAALVAYRSPVSNSIEVRTIYSDEYMEVKAWADYVIKNYVKLDFDFIMWINNHIEFIQGTLIREEDCCDE